MTKALLLAVIVLAHSAKLHAQRTDESTRRAEALLARRGAGLRGGVWNVEKTRDGPTFERGPSFEVYFQRGLDEHLAVESSVGVWSGRARQIQGITGNIVETETFVLPLMTALKVYPFTDPRSRLEPFAIGGIGFALGVANQGENAIGGGGTSIVTGFGFKGIVGLEFHISSVFGVAAATRYQWIGYGEEMADVEKFKGVGFDGAITYRFQF